MSTLVQADIFFFITTVALVFISILLGIAAIYIILILRDVKHVSKRMKEESEDLIADLHELRIALKKKLEAKTILSLVTGVLKRRRKTKNKKS